MQKTRSWLEVNKAIFGGLDPYAGFNPGRYMEDLQGWNSHHSFLSDTLIDLRPKLVIEVGVWKGASSIYMAETLRDAEIEGVVLAVDTWLGSWEHYEQADHFPSLLLQNGYPSLFYTFLTNVLKRKVEGFLHPLALDSANASLVLKRKGLRAQVVHIDAGHDYDAVKNDLAMWWDVLDAGGVMITDDYDQTGVVWPPVKAAVDDFLSKTRHVDFEAVPYKARFRKPI